MSPPLSRSDTPVQPDYHARIFVPVSADLARRTIFDQMTDWWSHRVDRTEDGATVYFGNSHVRFVFEGNDQLHWRCVEAHMIIDGVPDTEEWQGTQLIWSIEETQDGTNIALTHKGLTDHLACHDVCCRGWQTYFETSLQAHLSGGTPTPETR
ncbi:SRPBCC domain-containing protein [Shimia thalassica]|uniref:SRPBCC domain-containing protein n=1 Tax=Shimia thalassica TaxID=1715693 RepID=UPI0026E29601|nr:SRPBCC domain-containing protein [Shimia thalassica]MDO6482857.1 SRPBCC domain-containing protein [Shimia thalassica]